MNKSDQKGESMSGKKLSEELSNCLGRKRCADCAYFERKSVLVCYGLLQRVYEAVKMLEEIEDRNMEPSRDLTKDCCCELRQLKECKVDKKNEG